MDTDKLHSWLHLAMTPKVGPKTVLKLLHHFTTVENILAQDSNTLSQFVGSTVARLIVANAAEKAVNEAYTWLEKDKSNNIITLADSFYPKGLGEMVDPPIILFAKGDLSLLDKHKFTIIGTRHPTEQGTLNAFNFAKHLSNLDLTIVSGMADGIDRYAHLGALEGHGKTIGVIGTGIDRVYPASNKDLFHKVAVDGLLLSEFALGTQPFVGNFPRRNRIVAGLSKGCLVIESAVDGGSMITANMALEMGREVMAIPGSIHNPVARGCHKLIKVGAKLIETTNDIIEELQIVQEVQKSVMAEPINDPILQIMGFDAVDIDHICNKLNVSVAEICANLLALELDGHITNCGNGKYQRIFR
ncbi:MAG: dprA [Burkholderiales bacterium]|jgi:DNA processing protein|nr:dprA [Burkholderiales bacterium]MCE3268718.1 dprA [Burkholderiales bacterium]